MCHIDIINKMKFQSIDFLIIDSYLRFFSPVSDKIDGEKIYRLLFHLIDNVYYLKGDLSGAQFRNQLSGSNSISGPIFFGFRFVVHRLDRLTRKPSKNFIFQYARKYCFWRQCDRLWLWAVDERMNFPLWMRRTVFELLSEWITEKLITLHIIMHLYHYYLC